MHPRGGVEISADRSEELRFLRWDEIERDETQPRLWFDPERLESFADNILKNGVLQPITITRKTENAKQKKFRLQIGERRWRAVGILIDRGKLSVRRNVQVS